jgi:RNA recognition motif-containing protein
MKVDDLADAAAHKGTGFVRFKTVADANTICNLSQELERRLDTEHKNRSKDKAKDLVGTSSLLKGELELNGRRMVVLPSVARTKVVETVQANKDLSKGVGEDRRNLALKKEGLLNEKEWIHQQPAITKKDLE